MCSNLCVIKLGCDQSWMGHWEHIVNSFTNNSSSQGRNEGVKGGTIPRAPNHYGHRMTAGPSTPQVPTMSQVLSSTHYICFRNRPQVRTWGRRTCLLPRAPSDVVTPLLAVATLSGVGLGVDRSRSKKCSPQSSRSYGFVPQLQPLSWIFVKRSKPLQRKVELCYVS